MRRRFTAAALGALLAALPVSARAEPVLVSLEAAGGLALTEPQSARFGPGVFGSLAVQYPVAPALLVGLRLRAGMLADGDAPPAARHLDDPEIGSLESAALMLRVRPLAASHGVERATGLFIEGGGGGGLTGGLTRGTFEGGLGYGFALGDLSLAPVARYVQVMQPRHALSGEDARLFMLGVELVLLDARQASERPATRTSHEPDDRDADGIADKFDRCADIPEDHDGHLDSDGCPEPDNDQDGIPDLSDKCPDAKEDVDEYEDQDGCPEPDNDEDGFLDADDQCPLEAEIVNGNKDYDGCPDEGLIVMKNDRIVLEERVLFDFERARVKREARPMLRAIVNLKAQHPEWTELRIEGHADAQGDQKFNQELSERRANNVMKELVKLGIPASQIGSAGFGSTRPRDKRTEQEAHARNRRVEFVVMARGVAPAGVVTTPQADAVVSEEPAEEEPAPVKEKAP